MTDFADIKAQHQQTWGAGDYSVIATALYPTAEVLCEDVNFSAGQRVLDVASAAATSVSPPPGEVPWSPGSTLCRRS